MILEKLNKAYPYKANFTSSVGTFVFISAFISVFVFIFRSNQLMPDSSVIDRILISVYYGLATFAAASFNTLILKFIVTQKVENSWKVWNEILTYLLHFFTVSIALYLLKGIILGDIAYFSMFDLLKSFSRTIATGVIPVSIHVLIEQNKLYKKYYKQAQELESERKHNDAKETKETVVLGEYDVAVSDIIFLESNRNYVDITRNGNEILTVRMPLKDVEDTLQKYSNLIRCHRAYIVNIDKIEKVEGNAQGLKLSIVDNSFVVPVSRSYISKVSHLLRQ